MLVVALLIFLGPAKAVLIGFSILDSTPGPGESAVLDYFFKVEDSEAINLHNFSLMVIGPLNKTCNFYPNGTKIDSCPGIKIIQTDSGNETFGYGYGYNYLPGTLKFKIIINTTSLPSGEYNNKVNAFYDETSKETSFRKFTIGLAFEPLTICSFRAKVGETRFDNRSFADRSKLSLNIPISRSNKDGQGTFTSQLKKDRISYKFKVTSATRLSNSTVQFEIEGKFRDDLKTDEPQTGQILLDKSTSKASLIAGSLNASSLDVTFIKGC